MVTETPTKWRVADLTAQDCESLLAEHGNILRIQRATGMYRQGLYAKFQELGVAYEKTDANQQARSRKASVEGFWEKFGGIPAMPAGGVLQWPILDEQRHRIWQKYRKVLHNGKVLVLADLHVRLQRMDLIAEAIRRDGDADVGVLAGDVCHLESFSPFLLKTPGENLKTELEELDGLVELLCGLMPWVVIAGNHEQRLLKPIARFSQTTEGQDLMNFLEAGARNIITWILGRHKNTMGVHDWWVRLGDAAFCHADEFSSVPARSAENVADFFRNNPQVALAEGLRVVVQAHTHRQTDTRHHQYKCMETGCLSWDADYQRARKLGPAKKENPKHGYVVVRFKDGKADWNESHYVSLD